MQVQKSLMCVTLAILFLAGCSLNNSPQTDAVPRTKLLVQIHSHASLISSLIADATLLINAIIKDELHLEKTYDFDFFIPKERQRITLYYVSDFAQNMQDVLFSALEKSDILSSLSADSVFITVKTEFLGDQQDELVVIVDDRDNELTRLNQKIKSTMYQLNHAYKKSSGYEIYNRAKSEQFPFMPHMGLGRIRVQSIKNQINDKLLVEPTLKRIRNRIKEEVSALIELTLSKNPLTFAFDRIAIFEPLKGSYIKEWKYDPTAN
jgi:2'-5' RNA ligase